MNVCFNVTRSAFLFVSFTPFVEGSLTLIHVIIDEIMKIAESGNKMMLREKLHEIVPTYNQQKDAEVATTKE